MRPASPTAPPKFLNQINAVQAERRAREDVQPFTYAPSEDGFVFSIAQINVHIRLRDRLRVAITHEKARPAAA